MCVEVVRLGLIGSASNGSIVGLSADLMMECMQLGDIARQWRLARHWERHRDDERQQRISQPMYGSLDGCGRVGREWVAFWRRSETAKPKEKPREWRHKSRMDMQPSSFIYVALICALCFVFHVCSCRCSCLFRLYWLVLRDGINWSLWLNERFSPQSQPFQLNPARPDRIIQIESTNTDKTHIR